MYSSQHDVGYDSVVAFEPVSATYDTLVSNIKLNGKSLSPNLQKDTSQIHLI